MVVKKKKVSNHISGRRAKSANGIPPYQESIRRHLSKVPGVDAVYTSVDRGIVHVISVVEDHDSEIYDSLIPAENRVEKENPKNYFDFHVRARQKRTVEELLLPTHTLIFKK